MQKKQYQSQFVRNAIEAGWLRDSPLGLIDVGASGGIDWFWNQFRPSLRAVGFDPLVTEVERLNAASDDPAIRYEAAFVGDGAKHEAAQDSVTHYGVSSANRAAKLKAMNYIEVHFNAGKPAVWSDRRLRLDDYFADDLAAFDTMKVDTDSHDFFVLAGAKRLLGEGQLLFVECECQLQAPTSAPDWPIFAEIDKLMRGAGYRLVDLDCWRYSRAAMPSKFMYDIYAQTEAGQVNFCDALYALDFSFDSAALDRLRGDPAKLRKAVILAAAFGYPDIAADMLLTLKAEGIVPPGLDADAALDWLVPSNPFGASTYREYTERFQADPDSFKDSPWRAASQPALAEPEPIAQPEPAAAQEAPQAPAPAVPRSSFGAILQPGSGGERGHSLPSRILRSIIGRR